MDDGKDPHHEGTSNQESLEAPDDLGSSAESVESPDTIAPKEKKKLKKIFKQINAFVFTGAFLTVAFISLLFIFGTTTTLSTVVKPAACATCHAKLTVAQTLKSSSHAKFSCTTCHKSAGFGIFNSSQVVAANAQVDGITPIENKVCEQCHTMENRKVSPSTTIRIPHAKILAKGVKCVECHVGVMHGKRDTRGDGVVTFTGPRMPTCIKCHIERNLPTKCSFCHTDEKKPKSHDETWVPEGKHGQMAKKDVGVCQMCHAFTKDRAVNMGQPNMEAAEFARSNKFCSNCHMNNRPASHTEIWPIIHKAQAIPNMPKCFTCHDREKPQPDDRAVQRIYCNKCHAADKHPSDWRKVHPSVVKSIGIVEGKCFNCHASTHCAKCHKANNVRQLTPEQLNSKKE